MELYRATINHRVKVTAERQSDLCSLRSEHIVFETSLPSDNHRAQGIESIRIQLYKYLGVDDPKATIEVTKVTDLQDGELDWLRTFEMIPLRFEALTRSERIGQDAIRKIVEPPLQVAMPKKPEQVA